MKTILVTFEILVVLKLAHGAIDGLTYMDQIVGEKNNPVNKGEDPCNPLYWYPRNIPEHCQFKKNINPNKPESETVPMPIPVPFLPQPVIPILPSAPPPPIIPSPVPSPIMPPPLPPPMFPPPLPYAPPHPMITPYIYPYPPVQPSIPNLMPGIFQYPPIPSAYPPQAGLVPGIPGIVTGDGGINILPFSDVYSDLLQKHKQKIIHRKLQKVLEDYEDYPRSRSFRSHKRLRNVYYE